MKIIYTSKKDYFKRKKQTKSTTAANKKRQRKTNIKLHNDKGKNWAEENTKILDYVNRIHFSQTF